MLSSEIFAIENDAQFQETALRVFAYQFENNAVYRSFCDLLYKHPADVNSLEDIPFLPISFFKSHHIVSTQSIPEAIFESSGTTGQQTSKHHVADLSVYERSFRNTFARFYGNIKDYVVLGLLPSYLERNNASLVYMVNRFIEQSQHPQSGFYLNDYNKLTTLLKNLDQSGQKVLLIGVSFALLDLVEHSSFNLNNTIVMETGGMKGRRKEMIREELHGKLKRGFSVDTIHSEYGMTELLSQAYSKGNGIFECPPWMRILTREPEDAFSFVHNKTGGVNVIDLANIHSCSFIATQDLGIIHSDNRFEIIGRFDESDVRGCNLMVL